MPDLAPITNRLSTSAHGILATGPTIFSPDGFGRTSIGRRTVLRLIKTEYVVHDEYLERAGNGPLEHQGFSGGMYCRRFEDALATFIRRTANHCTIELGLDDSNLP